MEKSRKRDSAEELSLQILSYGFLRYVWGCIQFKEMTKELCVRISGRLDNEGKDYVSMLETYLHDAPRLRSQVKRNAI